MNAIFEILNPNNTVTVNRPLAHAIGLNEAVIYAALLAKCSYYTQNDMLYDGVWFYSTAADLFESTALSERQQRLCIDNLAAAGLIECKRMGMPAKRYFRVIDDAELLAEYIKQGEEKLSALKPCSDQRAEQVSPKSQNMNSRKGETSSDETAVHTYKTKENKSKDNQSINRDGIDRTDISRSDYLSVIRANIDYEALSDKAQVDELVEIMLDIICSNKPTVRVNGDEISSEVVKSRFMKLDGAHIDYVLTAMKKCPSEIRNIRAYLITALYNAPATMESYYAAWVNYDMNGRGT